ncbi:MAG: hypothetical protein KBT63_02520 [Porticoccaceae bacterium]|nr:hypothetical protein [Porticoccaceae bacterium]
MNPIKAIVLTYDKYRSFTDHMILRYEKLWPDHPYLFQVPYQELSPTVHSNRVQYHQCPPDIKGTVLTLLDGLDDEEMIYWCIDDKYPIKLDTGKIEKIHKWLYAENKENISGLLFCRCRGMLKKANLTGNKLLNGQGDVYLERKNYRQIWMHQYLKVKVIRHLFESFPDKIPLAITMDAFKKQIEKPKSHQVFVTSNNLAVFGESTSRGVITKNCIKSMKLNNMSIPSWVLETTPHEIIMGNESQDKLPRFINRLIKRST